MIQHLDERLVRNASIEVRRAEKHGQVVVMQCASHLSDQSGLAGARLSTDEEHLPTSLHYFGPQALQCLELTAPPDERKMPRHG